MNLMSLLFKLDAERAHEWAVGAIRYGSKALQLLADPNVSQQLERGAYLTRTLGLEFMNPIGLAAGFDKNAEIVEPLARLGFGFVEVGTVTPKAQVGNPKPRLFRDPKRKIVFNRMGFNGDGCEAVARRLERVRERGELPTGFKIGVNIGKNKDTPNEEAFKDYQIAAKRLGPYADYMVVNVSSPNTPGLRSLQTSESLRPIISSVREVTKVPLLLKLAPEVTGAAMEDVLEACTKGGVDGLVLTNTLSGTWPTPVSATQQNTLQGGLSGAILTDLAQSRLIEVRKLTDLPIISVGGILSPTHAKERLKAGAQLVQLYSGWIFGGPTFPYQVLKAISPIS